MNYNNKNIIILMLISLSFISCATPSSTISSLTREQERALFLLESCRKENKKAIKDHNDNAKYLVEQRSYMEDEFGLFKEVSEDWDEITMIEPDEYFSEEDEVWNPRSLLPRTEAEVKEIMKMRLSLIYDDLSFCYKSKKERKKEAQYKMPQIKFHKKALKPDNI